MTNSGAPIDRFVFYSWQTDTGPKQVQFIRKALKSAADALACKKDIDFPHVLIDEATRDLPGSPNISDSIRDKIRKAEVFVADVTLIHGAAGDGSKGRGTPNPNVMFELGFAVAELGWDRVIMLFDKELPMEACALPFDVRGNRASAFKKGDPAYLIRLLTEAVGLVLLKQPPRPSNSMELSPEQIKRERDVRALRSALSCIDMSVLDRMLEKAPGIIVKDAFHHFYSLDGVVSASTFLLYDETALKLVRSIRNHWNGLLSFGVHYVDLRSGDHKFKRDIGSPVTKSIDSDWSTMKKHVKQLRADVDRLVEHVHKHYLELEIAKLSKLASKERLAFEKSKPWA